jgi:alkylation response protein AidB-like acyl-CoA dehydrogenase
LLRLEVSEQSETLRREFKKWLASNQPPQEAPRSLEEFIDMGRKWQLRLASGGWLAVHWPELYGGRGLTLVEEAIIQEELVRVQGPQLLGLFGITMVGPVLIEHGTEEQKKRFLRDILSAEKIWCQGFSEPGAGSDLAAIKTRAERSKDGYLVTGQKIWTSFAHVADYCFILCRTSTGSKKHEGLSYLLLDMKEKGITTRPLKQISGDEEFNEVFLDGAFVPHDNLVGSEGQGWSIAISTLMYERVILTFARQLQSEVALRRLMSRFKADTNDAHLRTRLAAEIVTSAAVRALAYTHLCSYANGGSPGPEGSLDKLFWSESFQSIAKLGLEFIAERVCQGEESSENNEDIHRYLYSRGRTIAAGTSEIQRNIIAERILGLPR